MERDTKILLLGYFFISSSYPMHFIFAIMKADAITATIMVSIYFFASGILSIAFSRLSDQFMKRKIFSLLGIAIAIVAFTGYFFASTPALLVLLAGLVGVSFAAHNPTSSALLTEHEPDIPKGKLMSYFYVATSLGWAVGALIGGVISQYFGNFVFLLAVAFLLIAFIIYLPKLNDVPYYDDLQDPAPIRNSNNNPNFKIYSTMIIILVIAVLIRHFCMQGGFSLFPNHLQEELLVDDITASLILSSNMIVQSIIMLPLGRLVDHGKVGRKIILLIAIISSSLAVFLWSLIQSPWILIFPQMIIGLSWPATATSVTAIITDITSRRNRSRGMGWFNVGMALGGGLGPLFAGTFFAQSGGNYALTFQILSIFPLIAVFLVSLSFFEDRTTHQYHLITRKKNKQM
jgi:DHA1 family multidrug resistance protein-like MFS transporter